MSAIILYTLSLSFLAFSLVKDRNKTKLAIKKAWKSFTNLVPSVITVLSLVGISLSILNPDMISKLIGSESGIFGIVIALTLGSITMIPSFVAFPLAGALQNGGAGYAQIAALVSTLVAVGIITLPVEVKYFNKQTAIMRNGFAFIIAVIFTLVIGMVMS